LLGSSSSASSSCRVLLQLAAGVGVCALPASVGAQLDLLGLFVALLFLRLLPLLDLDPVVFELPLRRSCAAGRVLLPRFVLFFGLLALLALFLVRLVVHFLPLGRANTIGLTAGVDDRDVVDG
jgi:hypothetical protein